MMFLVCAAGTLQAQKLNLGIKGGINFADLNGDDVDGADGRTGYHFGVTAELGLGDKLSIQPEAIYSAQGVKDNNFDYNIDYINVPVLAKYYVVNNFSLQAGPQFGFKVNDKNVDAEGFDLSGAVGAEIKFGKIFGQARYNFGLTDVSDGDAKNAVFQLSIGINLL